MKEMFYTVFRSLNPDGYEELTKEPLFKAVKYFFFITILSTLIMLMLLLPALYSLPGYWNDKVQNFEQLNIDFGFTLKQPFYLMEDPAIRVEQSGSNMTDSRILISEDGIFYRSFIFFGEKKVIPLKDTYNLAQDGPDISKLVLFLLPALVFWGLIFFLAYFIVVVLISVMLAWIISAILGSRFDFTIMLKIGFYASTILVLTQLLLMPFLRTVFIPLIAYWLLLIIVLFLFKQSSHDEDRGDRPRPQKVASPRHEDEDSAVVKKSRKRDFEKENEGYVEWK